MDFYPHFCSKFSESLGNCYYDNVDPDYPRSLSHRIVKQLNRFADTLLVLTGRSPLTLLRPDFYLKNINEFKYLYDLIEDDDGRDKLIAVLLYRILGYHRVRLPLKQYMLGLIESVRRPDRMPVNFRHGYINQYDLRQLGHELALYCADVSVQTQFMLEQYRLAGKVEVAPGDVVIDCGGCWGDSALYFASRQASRVYVYEFIPSNLAVFEANLKLNPACAGAIQLVDQAVWSASGVGLSYCDSGPSSRVGEPGQYPGSTSTLSIDDLVEQQIGTAVHFIKMDIEGAEAEALTGAARTIARFGPKLAISVYHKPDDMYKIPKLIKSIRPDYKFYLDYYTSVGYEVVLYAIIDAASQS